MEGGDVIDASFTDEQLGDKEVSDRFHGVFGQACRLSDDDDSPGVFAGASVLV
jgi:hypothetical protein